MLKNNTVIISTSAAIVGNVYGAYSTSTAISGPITMTNNKVIVNGGNFTVFRGVIGVIRGASAAGVAADVSDNRVEISSGTGIKYVLGGRTITGTATLNIVTIDNVSISSNVISEYVTSIGTACKNEV